VEVRPPLEREKLGEQLIRLGRISRDEFGLAFQRAQADKERLGQVLVDAGLLDSEELGRLVALQVQKIVLSLLALTSGETRFHHGTDPIPRDLAVDLSTPRLLFEGARLFPDLDRIERALGDLTRAVRVSPMPPFDVSRVSLSPAEKEVLDRARIEARLADVLARPTSRPLAVRALYALLCGEILEEVSLPTPAPRLPHPPETGTFQMAVAPERGARPTPEAAAPRAMGLREHILGLYEALPRASHYEILEIAPDAAAHEVDAAYRRLTAEQDREWRDLMGDVQLSTMLSTLRLRRREAYLVLSDPNRRAAYDKRLGSAAPVAEGSVTAERNARARVLAQQAQVLVERGEPERAIPHLLEAVDLDPEERSARRLLALALANDPNLSRNAERHFLVALEQEPGDVDLRYRLARYYRRLGLPARALVHLRTVLRTDPDHAGAAHELATIEESTRAR